MADCPELTADDVHASLIYAAERESHEVPSGGGLKQLLDENLLR